MNVKIPDYWTPEQATAVFEFIEKVEDAIWTQYQLQIMKQLQSERCTDIEPDDWDINKGDPVF